MKKSKENKTKNKVSKLKEYFMPVLSFLIPVLIYLLIMLSGLTSSLGFSIFIFLVVIIFSPVSFVLAVKTIIRLRKEVKISDKIIKGILVLIAILLDSFIFFASVKGFIEGFFGI